jgi:glycosyltransferase involved in cell wall biosynthesis
MDRANLALAQYLAKTNDKSKVHLVGHRISETLLQFPNIKFHKVPKPLHSNWLGEPLLNLYGKSVALKLNHPCVIVNGGNCRTNQTSINWIHYVHGAWNPSTVSTRKSSLMSHSKQRISHQSALRHERIALSQSPLMIANSHVTKHQIVNIYQVDPARIKVVYYGTDSEEFSPVTSEERDSARIELNLDHNRPVIVFVGALSDSRKGFDILYDAWESIGRQSGWDAELIVVGSGKLVNDYKTLERSGRGPKGIRFLGFRNDVRKILAASDLLVSPARYEAYGLNVHESLCRNIPVLVSESAGVAERLPKSQGEDAFRMTLNGHNLAEKLIHWRNHMSKYAEKAAKAGEILREYSWDRQMESLMT